MRSPGSLLAGILYRVRRALAGPRTPEGHLRLGSHRVVVDTDQFQVIPKDRYDLVPKDQFRLIPREGYVYGPMDRYLLVPKNRYRVELLPDQPPLIEWGVGWLTEANTEEAYDSLWGDQANLARFREEGEGIRVILTDEVVEQVGSRLAPGVRVLDVGCGVGDLLAALREREPAIRPTGLDFSDRAVQTALTRLPDGDIRRHHLRDPLPHPDDSFHLVLCTDTLEHLDDPAAVVAELVRVCAPGGAVVVVVPDGAMDTFLGHRWFWSVDSLGELAGRWGGAARRLPASGELIAVIEKTNAEQEGTDHVG